MNIQTQSEIQKARSLADSGEIKSARKLYLKVLRERPHDPDLHSEFAFLEIQSQNYSSARKSFARASSLAPNDPDLHYNLAESCRLIGDIKTARVHIEKALALNPGDGQFHYALAELLALEQKWKRAELHIEKAREILPHDPEVLNLSGIIFEQNGNVELAEKRFLEALKHSPDNPETLSNLGSLKLQDTSYLEAIEYFEKSDSLKPLTESQLDQLYQAYLRSSHGEKALNIAERLIPEATDDSDALVRRGTAYQNLGNFEAAERDFRSALKANAQHAGAYSGLGTIRKLTPTDIATIERMTNRQSASEEDRALLWYTLFKGHQDQKNYEKAFECLTKANGIQARTRPVDIDQIVDRTTRLMDVFSPEFLARKKQVGDDRIGPVFVFGMPRSGTTLTERILAAHTRIFGSGERRDIPLLMKSLDDYPHCMTSMSPSWFKTTGSRVRRAMFRDAGDATYVTDKLPGNYSTLGLISKILPNSRFVYCKRNPIDNCLSCFEQNFGDRLHFTFDLDALATAYRQHERIMLHWIDTCRIPIHVVNYEDLVADPEPHIRALLDFIGVEWEEACLHPDQVDGSIATASSWQARQPINKGSVERWRRYEKELQPLVEALGCQE